MPLRKRPTGLICRIDVTAFLSIQIVLLSLFVAHLGDRPDRPMNTTDALAVAHALLMPNANREDAIIVAIQRDDAVWLGSSRIVSPEQLRTGIQKAVSHGAEHKVYIRADKRAQYGSVRQILDIVRSAGVEDVAFLWTSAGTRSSPDKGFPIPQMVINPHITYRR